MLEGNFDSLEKDIRKVKSQVMEFLESNDEARLFVEVAQANNNDEVACD